MTGGPDEVRERLMRLEEAQAFAERALEELGGEVRALGERLAELRAAVRRLEGQVERLAAPPDDTDSAEE